jgi:CRP-like cAMP-binding protein
MTDLFSQSGKTILLKRNDFLKTTGSTDTNLYFVEKGSIKVFTHDDGEEQILRFGYSGNILVSLDSFLTGKPSEICMQAIKKSVVKVISKSEAEMYFNLEGNQKIWINILENLIIQQMERETDILTRSPKKRFNRVFARSPRLFQEIPDKYIANYLRMSPETFSRLKSLDFYQDLPTED